MNAQCRNAHACSLSLHQSRLVIHPIGRSGSEFSTNFMHLVRPSALLKSHVVKSGVTGPPRRRRCASGFSERIVHASTDPISVSVALSLLLLLSADSGTVRCSLHIFRSPCSTGASVTSGGESTAWVLLWKTRSRSIGVRVCLVAQVNFFSTAFDPRAWTMVVFWKEDSGRRPHLITPENEGGDETSYPSPPKFFDDPEVPFGSFWTKWTSWTSWTARSTWPTIRMASSSINLLVIEKEWDLEMHRVSGYICDLHHPSLNLFRFL